MYIYQNEIILSKKEKTTHRRIHAVGFYFYKGAIMKNRKGIINTEFSRVTISGRGDRRCVEGGTDRGASKVPIMLYVLKAEWWGHNI